MRSHWKRWLVLSVFLHAMLAGALTFLPEPVEVTPNAGEVSMEVAFVREMAPVPPTPVVMEEEVTPVIESDAGEQELLQEELPPEPEVVEPVEIQPNPLPEEPVEKPDPQVIQKPVKPQPVPTPAPVKQVQKKAPAAPSVQGARVQKPSVIRNPLPRYPRAAIRAGYENVYTVLRVEIGTDGRAKKVRLARSCGRSDMDQEAIRTVERRWRFKPARRAGIPITVTETIRIKWEIR